MRKLVGKEKLHNKAKKTVKDKQGVKLGLFSFLMGICLLPLTISIVIISIMSSHITRTNLEDSTKENMYVVATNLAQYCSDNNITAMNASNYYDFLDNLMDRGIQMGIVAEGIPATTSIKNDNGFRVRDIPLPEGAMTNMEGTFSNSVLIDEKEYIGYYIPIEMEGTIKAVAFAGVLKTTVTGNTKSIIATYVVLAVIMIAVASAIALVFSKYLAKLFQVVEKHLDGLSRGRLDQSVRKSSLVKELSTLIGNTALVQDNLKSTIGGVKTASDNLAESVEQVTELSQDTSAKVSGIKESMNRLSEASSAMDDSVRVIHDQMDEIGEAVNEISGNVEQLYASSKRLLQTNEEAKENMDMLMDSNQKSVSAVQDITEQITKTNDSIAEIDKAVELILSIAQQTNLLSLNASIEAARAGELGKGFAVVAGEIRNLSEQSAQGAEMIRNLSGEIREKSHRSVGYAKNLNLLMVTEKESITATKEKFEEHSKEIASSANEIEAIAGKTERLQKNKEMVVENVGRLAGISDENAECNAEVTRAVGEIIEQVSSVTSQCETMNELAQSLKDTVSFFQS